VNSQGQMGGKQAHHFKIILGKCIFPLALHVQNADELVLYQQGNGDFRFCAFHTGDIPVVCRDVGNEERFFVPGHITGDSFAADGRSKIFDHLIFVTHCSADIQVLGFIVIKQDCGRVESECAFHNFQDFIQQSVHVQDG